MGLENVKSRDRKQMTEIIFSIPHVECGMENGISWSILRDDSPDVRNT
jgi:hypothetical protein